MTIVVAYPRRVRRTHGAFIVGAMLVALFGVIVLLALGLGLGVGYGNAPRPMLDGGIAG